jgi:hypothetical protein
MLDISHTIPTIKTPAVFYRLEKFYDFDTIIKQMIEDTFIHR